MVHFCQYRFRTRVGVGVGFPVLYCFGRTEQRPDAEESGVGAAGQGTDGVVGPCGTRFHLYGNASEELLDGFGMVSAEVVSNSVNKHNNYLTINKGEQDGVKPEMGVVCGTGIVGIVYLTSPHYAIVMPLLNSKSNISCCLRGTDYFGYLRWDGRHPLYASLGDIPRHARLKEGMTVETSGFSAVFPAGLFVGKVTKVENSEDGLSYKLQVNLSTDFAQLRDVCVLTTPNRVEIDSLQQKIESEK